MNSLGIYFGPKVISIVEAKGRKLANNIQLPCAVNFAADLEENKSTEDKIVEIVGLIQGEMRKNNISANNATFCLPGRDLIIRNFEIPMMPAEEMRAAINFEAKKYIPFKIEDLISTYQLQQEKASRTNAVVFIGIKKAILERYVSIASQLNLNIHTLEYSAFSLIRLLKLAGANGKGIAGVVIADLAQTDEVNFMVMHKWFPLFSRDISLFSQAAAAGTDKAGEPEGAGLLDKLKAELRVSLGYYQRKFYDKNIQKLYFILNEAYRPQMEAFVAELGLTSEFIDLNKITGKDVPYSSAFSKGFAASLSKGIKVSFKTDLLLAREKALIKEMDLSGHAASIFAGLRLNSRAVMAAVLICVFAWGIGFWRAAPLRKKLGMAMGSRVKVESVDIQATNEELARTEIQYKKTLEDLGGLVNKRVYFTEILDALPRLMPDGVWLSGLNFNKKKGEAGLELILKGMAYLRDRNQEMEIANKLISSLKENAVFKKYFREINIGSLEAGQYAGMTVTAFTINCKGY